MGQNGLKHAPRHLQHATGKPSCDPEPDNCPRPDGASGQCADAAGRVDGGISSELQRTPGRADWSTVPDTGPVRSLE